MNLVRLTVGICALCQGAETLFVKTRLHIIISYSYCTFERYSNVLHQISHNVQSAHACWCNRKVIVWLYGL